MRRLDIGAATDWGDSYNHLLNQAEHIKTANAEDESRFNLDAVLKSQGILPDESVYVAWDPRRADMNRMAFADLSRHFDGSGIQTTS